MSLAAARRSKLLVSPQWLYHSLQQADCNLKVLDCTWHMPATKRNAEGEFLERHIPTARRCDIDAVSADGPDVFPHSLPTAERFSDAMSALGVTREHTVVVYDTLGLFSAARVFWLLRGFNHADVRLLDGGLPAWIKEDLPLESGQPQPISPSTFTPEPFDMTTIRTFEQVQHLMPSEQIVDARSADRFHSRADEPRADVRRGCIPGSRNVPFTSVLTENGTFKSAEELERIFCDANVSRDKKLVFSCGSGVTACVSGLAAHLAGRGDDDKITVFDGAWTEYALKTTSK
eukprot:TRINITY_DN1177_c0_g1_i1.p1 TRINITY_DN1177_c0_g1~~TRINITY_DN1177_c0_g1_i1.p1  ORF type:complete len:289 (-),score=23.35 TRINITY_DN1177_c0_g1_i1:23-889(-)